jgi:two-component system, NtrC family, sensor kinase
VIRGRAETLARKLPGNDNATRNLQIIVSQISRIARIVHGTLDYARPRAPRRAPTAVVPVLRKVLEFLSQRIEEAGVRIESSLSGEFPDIIADADKLHEVFLNLATNALDAMPRGGTLRIRAECAQARHPERDGPAGPFLAITFEDNGSGIAAEHLGRVFESFFTTKKVGKGTGLGLSISHGIVRDHGGWIDVASEVNRGTRLTVYLPLPESPAVVARAAGEAS